VVSVIEPVLVDNEEEGYGRNAGSRRHYYRVAFPMDGLWPKYSGSTRDKLFIEVFETWLEEL
jgi:nitrile hydratase